MDARDEGRIAGLNEMRAWLVANRAALTVELSTGEYMGVDDMLDFIDRLVRQIRRSEQRRSAGTPPR